MIRLRTSYFAAALLAACSPVEDNREVDAPAADTTAPGVLKATPADMGRKVSVLQPITVVFDDDVDAATVTAATVELSYSESFPPPIYRAFTPFGPIGPAMPKHIVPAVVTYDAVSRTLRVVPKAPLPYAQRFTLSLTILKDAAGNELTTSIKFLTAVNHETRSRPFDTQAQPNEYTEQVLDANGFVNESLRRSDAGLDLIWFNTDDTYSNFIDVINKPNGQLEYEWFMGAGTDTALHTPDDVIGGGLSYKYDANNLLTEQTVHGPGMAGADMMYGTPDDGITGIVAYKYQAGLIASRVYYTGVGLVDTAWRTADDQCNIFFNDGLAELTYDTMGRRTREVRKSCGPDRLPSNVDDTFLRYSEYQYDANHALTRQIDRTGPGTNTMWLDNDDVIDTIQNFIVDPNGLVTEHRYYDDPGVNTMWENGGGDDVLLRLTKWTYDANKQPIEVTSYGPGLDAKLGSPDDVIVGYQKTTYDAQGNRIRSRAFDVGPDGAPYTGDDTLTLDTDYDTTH